MTTSPSASAAKLAAAEIARQTPRPLTEQSWYDLYPFDGHRHYFPLTESPTKSASETTAMGGAAEPRYLHYVDYHGGHETGDHETGGDGNAAAAPTPSKSAAKPVLFVHGNPTWSFYYHDLIQSLGDAHRCVAVDNLGCGLSSRLPPGPMPLAERIDHVVQLVEHLDLREIILCVHDWGGAIGLGAALRMSDRFAGLVIFNTAAFPPPYFPWRIRVLRTPLIGRWLVQGCNLFAGPATVMASEQGLTPEVKRGLLFPYGDWQRRRAVYEFVADIPADSSHRTWSTLLEIEAGLPGLAHLPCELVWGMRDWCFRPECLRRFQQLLPTAGCHELAAAGHYVLLDAATEVRSIVRRFAASVHGRR